MTEILHRVKRWFSLGLCAALATAVICMAVAVLVQALAVLVVALLAAALFLPHPLKWYAKEGAEAVRLFVDELLAPLRRPERRADPEEWETVSDTPARDDEKTSV